MRILAVLMILVFTSGCVSTGKKVDATAATQFKIGKSTLQDVVTALGNPESRTTDGSGKITLVYMYSNSQATAGTFIPVVGMFAGGAETEMASHTYVFNKNGVLEDQQHTEGTQSTKF